jgi:hypothetical protein
MPSSPQACRATLKRVERLLYLCPATLRGKKEAEEVKSERVTGREFDRVIKIGHRVGISQIPIYMFVCDANL